MVRRGERDWGPFHPATTRSAPRTPRDGSPRSPCTSRASLRSGSCSAWGSDDVDGAAPAFGGARAALPYNAAGLRSAHRPGLRGSPMSRRSLPVLLVLLLAIALGIGWLVRTVT